jgi:hypothetical protein
MMATERHQLFQVNRRQKVACAERIPQALTEVSFLLYDR